PETKCSQSSSVARRSLVDEVKSQRAIEGKPAKCRGAKLDCVFRRPTIDRCGWGLLRIADLFQLVGDLTARHGEVIHSPTLTAQSTTAATVTMLGCTRRITSD